MRSPPPTRLLLTFAAALAVLGCGPEKEPYAFIKQYPEPKARPINLDEDPAVPDANTNFAVAPPPFSDGIFPCTSCHAVGAKLDPASRDIGMHDDLHHGPGRWCFDCHNPDNRDVLRLASGKLIPFSESYRLCGQCHGDKYRDWRVGVHGRRTGEWNGKKQYLLCVSCHNPHSPHFKPLKPLPPPIPPASIR